MRWPLVEIGVPLGFQDVELGVSIGFQEERKGFQEASKRNIFEQSCFACLKETHRYTQRQQSRLILLNGCTAHASCHHNAWPPRERASSRLPSGASAAALGRVNGRTVYTAAGSMRRRVSSLQVGERVAKRDRADE